ncbi:MAG: DUF1127 domain-containing protein [Burkholderiales bacterium]
MNTPSNTRRPIDLYRFEAGLRSAAWTALARAVASALARLKTWQTIRELSALSDRQLNDIGLRRADIEDVAASSSSPRF